MPARPVTRRMRTRSSGRRGRAWTSGRGGRLQPPFFQNAVGKGGRDGARRQRRARINVTQCTGRFLSRGVTYGDQKHTGGVETTHRVSMTAATTAPQLPREHHQHPTLIMSNNNDNKGRACLPPTRVSFPRTIPSRNLCRRSSRGNSQSLSAPAVGDLAPTCKVQYGWTRQAHREAKQRARQTLDAASARPRPSSPGFFLFRVLLPLLLSRRPLPTPKQKLVGGNRVKKRSQRGARHRPDPFSVRPCSRLSCPPPHQTDAPTSTTVPPALSGTPLGRRPGGAPALSWCCRCSRRTSIFPWVGTDFDDATNEQHRQHDFCRRHHRHHRRRRFHHRERAKDGKATESN